MPTADTRTFRSGNSQAVRLPREIAYDGEVELTAVRSGDVITLYPKKKGTMAELVEALAKLPKPGSIEVRDTDEIPERQGL